MSLPPEAMREAERKFGRLSDDALELAEFFYEAGWVDGGIEESNSLKGGAADAGGAETSS